MIEWVTGVFGYDGWVGLMDLFARECTDAVVFELDGVVVIFRVGIVEGSFTFEDFGRQPGGTFLNEDIVMVFMKLGNMEWGCRAVCIEAKAPIVRHIELRTTGEKAAYWFGIVQVLPQGTW